MKEVPKVIFLLLVNALLANAGSYTYSYGSTIVGDIRIQTLNNGNIYCDSMICPPEASNCRVTKRNDPNNFQVIERHRACFDRNGAVVLEERVNEPNSSNGNVNVVVSSGAGGNSIISNGSYRELTPEEQRELEEQLRRTQQQVQAQVSGAMNHLHQSLGPLLDGSFGTNLSNNIRSSVANALRFG